MSRSLRTPLLVGAATALVAAAGLVALALPVPTTTTGTGEARITRLFIPAIKDDCRRRAEVPADAVIGYTFDRAGALQTLDRDGSLTGVAAGVLTDFNDCLAQYPIQPFLDAPHDHYNRNLLYDYFVTDLRPCLADRVSDLPPMPSRADFVVRLFVWDPYRVIAPGLSLAQLIELERSCPAMPDWVADPA
jgi:hypothetical protein